MGDIYATAAKTLIWLGEEDDNATRAMAWLEHFLQFPYEFIVVRKSVREFHTNHLRTIGDILSGDTILPTGMTHQAVLGDKEARVKVFGNMWMLIRRACFMRKWVIQEVAKSERHAIVLVASSKSITRHALKMFYAVLSASWRASAMFINCFPRDLETQSSKSEAALIIERADQLAFTGDQDAPLLSLLAATLDFSCTNFRDHIIALLGISTNGLAYEDLIDYDSPTAVLSYRLAQASLEDPRDLHQLWSFGSVLPIDSQRLNASQSRQLDVSIMEHSCE